LRVVKMLCQLLGCHQCREFHVNALKKEKSLLPIREGRGIGSACP
jgi:hypothetical protein